MGILFRSLDRGAQNTVSSVLLEPGGFETIFALTDQSPRRTSDLREVLNREGIVFDSISQRMGEAGLIQSSSDQTGLTLLGIEMGLLRWKR